MVAQGAEEVSVARYPGGAQGRNYVPLAHPGVPGWATRYNLLHQRARVYGQVEPSGVLGAKVCRQHAEVGSRNLALLDQLVRHRDCCVRRHGEAQVDRPGLGRREATSMPMISPSRSPRAPPELPGEIAASVWIRSVRARLAAVPLPVSSGGNSRPTPLTTPEVTVDSKPDGLPMATASWPTTGASPSNVAAGRSLRFTFITAISVFGSAPTTPASSMVPSAKATFTSVAPSMTWLLVTM